jgi:hypothetical protein
MFDRPVVYNGFQLNTVTQVSNGVRRGCMLEVFDYSRLQGVGDTEKRSQDDGPDASDVFMAPRYINLAGVIYGQSSNDLNDLVQQMRRALTPTAAYAFDPWDYGYIPLEFELPTNMTAFTDIEDGIRVRKVEYRARPTGQPSFTLRRDGGSEPGAGNGFGMAVSWQASLECKDPRMYVRPDRQLAWVAENSGMVMPNRGDYPAPLDILLVVNTAPAGSWIEVDVGGSQIAIFVGGLAANTIVRYSGELKVLTIDSESGGEADILRMDLFTLRNDTTHPKVLPGNQLASIRFFGAGAGPKPTFKTGTRFMYSESFA